MNFNDHSNLRGLHAVFGASQSSWLRYSPEKMREAIISVYRKALGTEIHGFAFTEISLNHKYTTVKQVKQGIESYIFNKYYSEDHGCLSEQGRKLLYFMKELPNVVYETVKIYINDCVGYRMTPEQPLEYSKLFFGTSDAICFRGNFLRIHDLKTGSVPVHIEQLLVYTALFCIEYKIKPGDIQIELRIYQNGEVLFHNPKAEEILPIMDKIISDNKYLSDLSDEEKV